MISTWRRSDKAFASYIPRWSWSFLIPTWIHIKDKARFYTRRLAEHQRRPNFPSASLAFSCNAHRARRAAPTNNYSFSHLTKYALMRKSLSLSLFIVGSAALLSTRSEKRPTPVGFSFHLCMCFFFLIFFLYAFFYRFRTGWKERKKKPSPPSSKIRNDRAAAPRRAEGLRNAPWCCPPSSRPDWNHFFHGSISSLAIPFTGSFHTHIYICAESARGWKCALSVYSHDGRGRLWCSVSMYISLFCNSIFFSVFFFFSPDRIFFSGGGGGRHPNALDRAQI